MTREEVVHCARTNRVWETIRGGLGLLLTEPNDDQLRLLVVEAMAGLGLRTMGGEQIEQVTPAGKSDAAFARLKAELAALRDDEFKVDARLAIGGANVGLLGERRGLDLLGAFDAWSKAERGWQVFATKSGDVIRRPIGELDPARWFGLSEQRRPARAFAQRNLARAQTEAVEPIIVEGFNPPWIFVEMERATPRLADGYQPRIRVVQRSAGEFFEGATLIDMRSFIEQDRIEWFIGEQAGQRLGERLQEQLVFSPTGSIVTIEGVRLPIEPPVSSISARTSEQLKLEIRHGEAAVGDRYRGRDAAWWARRFDEALSPDSTDPLRVFIPTTRYSTFVQHSAGDLADAFRRAGCAAKVFIEPDDHSIYTALAYHQAFERFEPDLVVLINYPRYSRQGEYPAQVPFVCWIQDAMSHLYDARIGSAQTDLDFLVGHCVDTLFRECNYRPKQAHYTPVVVSQTKFHNGPISLEQRERFGCEIAFVSHHSETPETMHERIYAETTDPKNHQLLTALRQRVHIAAADLTSQHSTHILRGHIVEAAKESIGFEPSADEVTQVLIQYARPLLERIVRHEALGWAADVCERNGWRLKIFGRGWETHDRFTAFSQGELAHGDDLRACYQAAAVHLHPTGGDLAHQRVMECALSGGLCVGRFTHNALPSVVQTLINAGADESWADRCSLERRGLVEFKVADHPLLMQYAAQRQRLGLPVGETLPGWPDRLAAGRGTLGVPGRAETTGQWLFGDLAELTFTNADELEAVVKRAIERPRWRVNQIDAVANRVRQRLTYEGLVNTITTMVRTGMASSSEPALMYAG